MVVDVQTHVKILQAHRDGTLAMDMDVKTIMDTWTLQMGFPVITVTRYAEQRRIVSDQNFVYQGLRVRNS